ncbi:lysM domain receptor-like kinase 4 [Humulus lupulus]|uniref:lysM domain receptor-like kinase 4 n=1 Tax=Humulus lupulus TaxID=3486 RepID=UPI002B40855C|nr:lysM domain receptor-like kinase 4 [Humulus lupulus]
MKYFYWVLVLIRINLIYAQQYYDPLDCPSNETNPGTRYTCSVFQDSCKTFLVYRANQQFQAISRISKLFSINSGALLQLNNLTSFSELLKPGRDVLVPINCSCSGHFFQANFSYTAPETTSLTEVACGVFEGLVKMVTLSLENPFGKNNVKAGSKLHLPLKCACPDNFTSGKGIKYLVTYPLIEGDKTSDLTKKFGISPDDLSEVNRLGPGAPTIFTQTTILVPLRADSVINLNIPGSPSPAPSFLPTVTVEKPKKNSKRRKVFIAGSIIGIFLVLVLLIASAMYVKALMKMRKSNKYHSFTSRSSPISSTAVNSPKSCTARSSTCLSPDLLVGIKFSLFSYSMEEIKRATTDFCEENKVCSQVYKGTMDNVKVIIKQMRFEDTRPVIDVHSKINHINIVKLLGVCYGESDFSWCYIVFEYPGKGCLRDCLSNPTTPLRWHQRTQIAFDIATGLHYLNFCTFPSYAHMNLHSRNIFVTSNCRAKLGDIGSTPFGASSKGNYCNNRSVREPEYLPHSSATDKIDIFAFGIVLLELISGRECYEETSFRESIRFLGGGASEGGCFEQLKNFMDPFLKEDYSLAETLCLSVLAKSCVEDDPLHRPSMEDIIKVLARMVYSF